MRATRKKIRNTPVMEKMCASCPFREHGLTEVRGLLVKRSLTEGSPICHSTGDSDVVPPSKKLSQEDRLCRGARNFQLIILHDCGFLTAATDEAWEAKRQELGV